MGVVAIFTLIDVIEMAKKAKERVDWQPRYQSNRNFNYIILIETQQYRGNYNGQPSRVINSGNPQNTVEERRDSKGKIVINTADKGDKINPYQKPTGDLCCRCRQLGHRSNNCLECKGVNNDR
ncbi:hypothetical protein MANES_01G169950v8 [Manihot esculenta]|uniref:Uncharacterized protein n=1 Tax=Manihot esculenta TaxID=3983 RepID=A0ACB7IFP3_MANES|nr:hypothetical protein MANES_01G169950v8 [Manihot esculenta]